MIHVFFKEVSSFFSSLVGYFVLVVFLLMMGLFVWVFPQTSVANSGYADLQAFFMVAPYVFMFLIPAITMRSFSEEKRAGTMELLLTHPLRDLEIIFGKYFSCLFLVAFALAPTTIYYYSIYELGMPVGNIDGAAVAGAYIGLFFLAAVFTAIGIFASSITDSQIVGFILSVFLCFTLYEGFNALAQINFWSAYAFAIGQLGIDYHYNALGKGVIDSRSLVYFFSLIALMIALTKLVLGSRKW